jgi:hypothetical protein
MPAKLLQIPESLRDDCEGASEGADPNLTVTRRASLGYNPSGMLVGIGFAIGLVIAVAIIRSSKRRSKQNRNRIFRDYVRRTY